MKDETLENMGKILTRDMARDAVHIAVVPVVAGERLRPGAHICLRNDGLASRGDNPIGIVDPYLRANVAIGERFFLFLYPGSITSLKHQWTHPAFPEPTYDGGEYTRPIRANKEAALEMSRKLLAEDRARTWCAEEGFDYEEMIARLIEHADDEYVHVSGQDASGEVPDFLWTHVENIIGRQVTKRGKYFSCAC